MQEKMDGFDSILNFQLETQMDNRVGADAITSERKGSV